MLGDLDVGRARGLEIGPLHNPRVRKSEGDIRYLDHTTAEGLRAKYANDADAAPLAHLVVDVDYVWQPGQRIRDAVAGTTFDYVIASHLLEHVPNPLGWLEQVYEVLNPGGLLALVLPDKRYCFDVNRGLTTMADLVDAYLRRLEVPSFRQIYDHEANFVPVDIEALWNGGDGHGLVRQDVEDPERFAFQCCVEHATSTGEYRDVHCHTFTPASFLGLLHGACRLGLFGFDVISFHPTEVGQHEFFVTLQRPRQPISTEEQLRHISSFQAMADVTVAAMPPTPAPSHDGTRIEVSDLERRLIGIKRSLMTTARRLSRR